MAVVTRRIGLSLGADICWPIAFERILVKLDEGRKRPDHLRRGLPGW